jgi:hypothetical protein
MRMRVRESGDEVHIELSGIAGRQQRVLQVLSDCCLDPSAAAHSPQDPLVRVRAGTDAMRIRIRPKPGRRTDAATLYQCLRTALLLPAAGNA